MLSVWLSMIDYRIVQFKIATEAGRPPTEEEQNKLRQYYQTKEKERQS